MPHNKHVEDGFNIDVGLMQPDENKCSEGSEAFECMTGE